MSERRFFCPNLRPGKIELPQEESHHALTVLRLKAGDEVTLFDGRGGLGSGRLSEVGRKGVSVEVAEVRRAEPELSIALTLAVALIKGHRQAYLVEKCTELGVAEIVPVHTARSVVRRIEAGADKWNRRAIEAAKQSGRAWLPIVREPRNIHAMLQEQGGLGVVADLTQISTPFVEFLRSSGALESLTVWIGPEGGWTDEERKAFASAGVRPVRLACTTLRTETAAIAACAIVAAHCLTIQA